MKSKMSLFAAIVVSALAALTTGCYAETGYIVTNDAYAYDYAEPGLVSAGPNVWIVHGQPSVYYADDAYWTYTGNGWYRSSYANRGWVAANSAPGIVVNHYHSVRPVNHHVASRPRVVHRPAQPRIVRESPRPRVHVAQTKVQVRAPASKPASKSASKPASKPAPSVRVNGRVKVSAKPRTR